MKLQGETGRAEGAGGERKVEGGGRRETLARRNLMGKSSRAESPCRGDDVPWPIGERVTLFAERDKSARDARRLSRCSATLTYVDLSVHLYPELDSRTRLSTQQRRLPRFISVLLRLVARWLTSFGFAAGGLKSELVISGDLRGPAARRRRRRRQGATGGDKGGRGERGQTSEARRRTDRERETERENRGSDEDDER